MEIRFLNPDEFDKINHFFDNENVPRLDPNWSKVIGAVDEKGEVLGIMCLQLVAHAEPIIIDEKIRRLGLWREMADMMDGYVQAVGLPGLYTQPTHPTSEAMCKKIGFEQSPYPLYVKIYQENFDSLIVKGD